MEGVENTKRSCSLSEMYIYFLSEERYREYKKLFSVRDAVRGDTNSKFYKFL